MTTPPSRHADQATLPRWKLEEAWARFNEVARLAAAGQPQWMTVHGRDAVVVVGADKFDRLRALAETSLHGFLSRSPLNRLAFGGEPVWPGS